MKKNYFISLIAMLFCCISANAQAELTFSNVSLEPGSKVEALAADQQITFNTNMDEAIGYMYAEIKDESTGDIVGTRTTVYDPNFDNVGLGQTSTDMPQAKKNPHFTYVSPVYTKMTEGRTYSIIFYAFTDKNASYGAGNVLATGSIQYEGATAAYIPSPFKLIAITPDPKSHIITKAEESAITLTFSSKVRLNEKGTFVNTGFGTSAAFASIVPGDDAETVTTKDKDGNQISEYVYSSSWTLTPKTGTISDGVDVIYAADAYDKSGLHVTATATGLEAYSTGNDETSYYTFTVSNDFGRETFTTTPAVDDPYTNSLYSFVVTNTEDGISAANIAEKAELLKVNEDGSTVQVATVATIVDEKVIPSKGISVDDKTVSQRVFLDKPVTAAGKYILHFPRNYFTFGTGMTAPSSADTKIEYTLAADFNAPEAKLLTDTEVKNLSKIEIQYPAFEEVAPNPDKTVTGYIINAENELVTKVNLDACWDYDQYANVIDCNLQTPITTPGTYKLLIPQDAITGTGEGGEGDDDYEDYQLTRGGVNLGDGDDDSDFEPEYTLLGAFIQEFTVVAGSTEGITLKTSVTDGEIITKPFESLTLTFEAPEGTDVEVACTGWDTDAWWRGTKNFVSSTECSGNTAIVTPYTGVRQKVYGITDNGEYTVTFPEGFFTVNGADWPEIKLTFTLDIPSDIEGTEADADTEVKSAFTVSGAAINPEDAAKGIYILNGKKVSVK